MNSALIPFLFLIALVVLIIWCMCSNEAEDKAEEEFMEINLHETLVESERQNCRCFGHDQVHQRETRRLNLLNQNQAILIQQLIAENEFLQSRLQNLSEITSMTTIPESATAPTEDSPPSYQDCLESLR